MQDISSRTISRTQSRTANRTRRKITQVIKHWNSNHFFTVLQISASSKNSYATRKPAAASPWRSCTARGPPGSSKLLSCASTRRARSRVWTCGGASALFSSTARSKYSSTTRKCSRSRTSRRRRTLNSPWGICPRRLTIARYTGTTSSLGCVSFLNKENVVVDCIEIKFTEVALYVIYFGDESKVFFQLSSLY